MRKGFKRILRLIVIISFLWLMVGYVGQELLGINIKGGSLELNNKNSLVYGRSINLGTELVLVNHEYGLEQDYRPKNLTIPNIEFADGVSQEEKHVAEIIAKPLEELIAEAKGEGITLLGNSGYRSYDTQWNTYSNRVRTEGEEVADAFVARPGFSEHQTGLCIDITNEVRNFAKGTKEADWLSENCYKFGFIIRYPYGKKSVTGIEYEPWHIRYVGEKAAKYITDNDITLEEYLGK